MKPERFEAVLLLPRLRVQNANAISSPLTWGFPTPSAFTGFVHALQRRLNAQGQGLRFGSVGIVCHQFEPQTYRPPGRYTQVFSLTRAQIRTKEEASKLESQGSLPAIVEEGRTHLEVSLLITVSGEDLPADGDAFAAQVLHQAEGMRLAGGSILPQPQRSNHPAWWVGWPDNSQEQNSAFAKLRPRLAPGFVLVSRAQLLSDHLAQMQQTHGEATALDALLDLCALHHAPPTDNTETMPGDNGTDDGEITATEGEAEQLTEAMTKAWSVSRRKPGWLVPLPVGYAAISPLYAAGEVKNARDNDTPFRFVESVLSLGEWVGPHRIKTLQDLLWVHHAQPDAGLYLTHNGAAITPPATSISPSV
jgi:CRISPR-associated protein Csy2